MVTRSIEIDVDLRVRIEREFFSAGGVSLDWSVEGQRIDCAGEETRRVIIGAVAGPSSDLSHLCHEMAHLVEIDDGRMTQYGWGLRFPEVFVYDRMCCEPTTLQMTERETRVIAYQANLLEYLGLPVDPIDLTRSLKYMPDFLLVPLENGTHPYAESEKDTDTDLDSSAIDDSRVRWLANRVQGLRETFTLARFLSEWARKTALLRDRGLAGGVGTWDPGSGVFLERTNLGDPPNVVRA